MFVRLKPSRARRDGGPSGTAEHSAATGKGGLPLNRKLNQLLQPSYQLYFFCLLLFTLLSALYSLPLAAAELAAVVCLGLYSRVSARRRRREITKYLENYAGTVDTATKDTMVNSPLPMVLFRPESDDIIWTNDRFLQLTGQREHISGSAISSCSRNGISPGSSRPNSTSWTPSTRWSTPAG